jgi:hypothetical protein
MTQLVQAILERLAQLPEPIQERFAKRFLKVLEEAEAQTAKQPRKRIAGLGKGTMVIADDFDEPLPDSFWLGEKVLSNRGMDVFFPIIEGFPMGCKNHRMLLARNQSS